MNAKILHEKAQELVTRYLKTEAELIEILQKIGHCKTYRELGSPSLYAYATEKLGLPDGAAYNLITVARKDREVPALQAEIKNGTLTVSKARRIARVLTLEETLDAMSKLYLEHRDPVEKAKRILKSKETSKSVQLKNNSAQAEPLHCTTINQ